VREHEDFAMFLLDGEGHITSWNRGVERIFGYQEEEWIGLDGSVIFTGEDRAAAVPESEMRKAAEHGRAADVRWHLRKDGSRIYLNGVIQALHDESGNLAGFSKVAMDDTTRKRLEDALTQSNADLQQFAFVASHDMQEPLRTIASLSDLLERRHAERLDQDARELLHLIRNAAASMSALIRDLLAYSQLEEDQPAIGSGRLDDDLETAITLLRTSIHDSGAVITHDPLPEVQVSRGHMVRLFQNVIGNAIKFCKPSEPPRIHVSSERAGAEWIIRVRDNGIGFAPEHAESIFAPFKRLHSSHQYPGSGIGLAACKRIVERCGGRIGAESEPGKGSTFWFTIPVELERR
jgi:PAS domain S-box-containing protein